MLNLYRSIFSGVVCPIAEVVNSMMNADFEFDGVFVKRQRAKLFGVGLIGVVHTTLGARGLFFGTEPSWKHVGREIVHFHLEGHAVQIDAQMTCKIS
jgi:hypothetical protein